MNVSENTHYKHNDYSFRAIDPYAFRKYKVILKWLPNTPNLHVLNAGCGSGEMNWLLATKDPTWTITAIDIDTKALEIAHDLKARHKLDNLSINELSIENWRSAERYDIIISNDVLEHIENDEYALTCLFNLLKPNGMLGMSVPAMQWLYGLHDEALGHYRRYNKRLLTERLSRQFEVKQMRYFGALLVPVALWYSRLLHKPYPLKSQENERALAARVVSRILDIEERWAFPTGTSLLAQAVPKTR